MLGLVLFAAAAVARPEAPVQADAAQLKIGAELRAEAVYRNHGLDKEAGKTVKATTDIEVQHANLVLAGTFAKDDEAAFGFNLRDVGVSPLDYGYFTHNFGKLVSVSMGKMRVLQGGWDNASYEDFTGHATGVYADNLVYDANSPMLAVALRAGGTITLQVLNDKVMGEDPEATWNMTAHPTWVLGWQGEFGPITPLIDVGSYDNNHSRWVDAGIKTEMNGLAASLDLYNKNQVNKYHDAAGKSVGKADVSSGITLNVAYEVKGVVTPWFYFSQFIDKQATDNALGIDDHDYNTSRDANGAFHYDTFDDNGQVVGAGININAVAKGWTPYVAFVTRSGKFENPKHAGESQDKSESLLRLGVLGQL